MQQLPRVQRLYEKYVAGELCWDDVCALRDTPELTLTSFPFSLAAERGRFWLAAASRNGG